MRTRAVLLLAAAPLVGATPAPDAASIRGEAEQAVHLSGRMLSWRGRLELVSDRERFHYRLRRELFENGRLIRERTWEEKIPRDHQ